ncbi:hypothetical protein [Natrinema soli]|uniref:DUF1059 domain-containing protein n=1 Tax=Natrinema soli TaxID=1930624 RepID=A0ABD5SVR7_9EURY|nr:hypothetical protein [Natrinema soli]
MDTEQHSETIRIVCNMCAFSKEVTTEGDEAAEVIREHGQKTGHKLTTEELDAK